MSNGPLKILLNGAQEPKLVLVDFVIEKNVGQVLICMQMHVKINQSFWTEIGPSLHIGWLEPYDVHDLNYSVSCRHHLNFAYEADDYFKSLSHAFYKCAFQNVQQRKKWDIQ